MYCATFFLKRKHAGNLIILKNSIKNPGSSSAFYIIKCVLNYSGTIFDFTYVKARNRYWEAAGLVLFMHETCTYYQFIFYQEISGCPMVGSSKHSFCRQKSRYPLPNLNWDLSLYLGGRRPEHFLSDIRVYKAFILPTEEQVLLPSIRNGRTYMYLKSQITIVSSYYYS